MTNLAEALQETSPEDSAEVERMFIGKACHIASVLWVERVTKAVPATIDIEVLSAMLASLVQDLERVEQVAMLFQKHLLVSNKQFVDFVK